MIRWLRGLFGTVKAQLLGAGTTLPAVGTPAGIALCSHPARALTACTYQLGPKGKRGWFYRCRQCLGWFSC